MTSTERQQVGDVRKSLETVLMNLERCPATLTAQQWQWKVETACSYLRAAVDECKGWEDASTED